MQTEINSLLMQDAKTSGGFHFVFLQIKHVRQIKALTRDVIGTCASNFKDLSAKDLQDATIG